MTVTSFSLSSHFPSRALVLSEGGVTSRIPPIPWELTRREKVLTSNVKQNLRKERSLCESERESCLVNVRISLGSHLGLGGGKRVDEDGRKEAANRMA